MRIPVKADDTVVAALRRLGRTEDVQYSPSGGRIALVGLFSHRLLILDVKAAGDPLQVVVSGGLEVNSPSFDHPHGMGWLDERTIVVASRGGAAEILELPERRPQSGRVELVPVRTLGTDRRDLVKTPGSVSIFPIGLDLVELLVCNNHGHHISRHILDRRNAYALLASESVIDTGPHLPDGVEHSRSGRWIAVSNHDAECVMVFRNDDELGDASAPQGVLRNVRYPHGLAFTPDEQWLLVADAGAPFVHVFKSDAGNWKGEREAFTSIQVLDDATYERGAFGAGEGGPKGIALSPDGRLLVATCKHDQLVFVDVRPVLGNVDADPATAESIAEAELARVFLLRYLESARSRVDDTTAAIRRTSEREVQAVLASRWWRLVAPMRRMSIPVLIRVLQTRHWLKRQARLVSVARGR